MKLSVVIPVYNEINTLQSVIDAVKSVSLPRQIADCEIILVDDYSTDGTREYIQTISDSSVVTCFHERNYGKGRALATGMAKALGDVILIQDADLEYNPHEYPVLLEPILTGKADVVYGSRFSGGQMHRVLYFWHSVGNAFLTLLSNMFADINLTDMETCYKVFKKNVIRQISIEENRFGFEPEITAKVSDIMRRDGLKIFEVGISYNGRTYEEGKKIGWKDGVRALWCILKYNTTKLAELCRYGLAGIVVLCSQLLAMYGLVEYAGLQDIAGENIANIISTEIGFLVAFFIHRSFIWRSTVRDSRIWYECVKFHGISLGNIIARVAVFYALSRYTAVYYLVNVMVSVIVVLVLNFIMYRMLFKKRI